MNIEKSFGVQQQAIDNTEELQTYLRDLENWEKDMKKKEEELKLMKITESDTIPPIRNSLSRSKKKNKHKKQKENKETIESERISSYNYKAWENFDVDSELKKLDEEKKESSVSEEGDSEEEFNLQERKQLAILKKDKGNEFFKTGDYDCAINCYTVGMDLDPENPLLPANRAMAFIKKEQYQAAEDDCSLCLSLDPTYVKVLLRRATARRALNKLLLAEEDYLKILELEPENKSAKVELEKVRQISDKTKVNGKCTISNQITSELKSGKNEEKKVTPSMRLENLLNTMVQSQPNSQSSSEMVNDNLKQSSHLKYTKSNKDDKTIKQSVEYEDIREIEHVIKRLEQTLPPVPSAAYQFLTDWRKLSKYPDLKYQYLKQFPPEKLPIVFKHDMEAEIFCGILKTLSTSFLDNSDDVCTFLKYLTQVGRFETLLFFLSSQEKQNLKKLFDFLKNEHSSPEVENLLKLYKMN